MKATRQSPRIKIVRNAGGYWLWQLWSANGRSMICEGGQRYLRRNHAIVAAKTLAEIATKAEIELEEGGGA